MLKIHQLKQAKGPALTPIPQAEKSDSQRLLKPAELLYDSSVFLLLSLLVHLSKWPVVHGDSIFCTGVQQLIQHKKKHIPSGRAGTASCLCLLSTSALHEQATQVSLGLGAGN